MIEFWRLANSPGQAPALILPGGRMISYDELTALSEAWKERLLQGAGSRSPVVALEFVTSPEAIAAYLGALRGGFPVLVAEPGQLGAESTLCRHWQPQIRITARGGTETSESELSLTFVETGSQENWPDPHPDLRLLLSTSGTTGDPKLVRLSGTNIAANAASIMEYLAITSADRAITTLPLFYSYGLSVLHSYLGAGASIVLTQRSITEPAFWEEFRDHAATSLAFVPHQFDLLDHLGFDGLDLSSLRYITQAGGKLSPDAVRRFSVKGRQAGWELFVMYGQTEAAPRMSYVPPQALPEAADTIGRPVPGGQLSLRADNGDTITGAGVPGELIYRGPNVMMGYAEHRADLALGPQLTELQTGDIAEKTPEGFFRIVGRSKRIVKLFGLRLSLDQIESMLREHGIVAYAAAVDDRLVVLCCDASQSGLACDLIAETYDVPLNSTCAGYLPEVPTLASGKVDLKALRSLAEQALSQAGADRTASGSLDIAAVLGQATRRRSVEKGESFNSLGGDSLSYLQVQMALEEHLGCAPDGWEDMSLEALEALTPAVRDAGQRTAVGIDVILRLIAITLVIGQHASDYLLFGGAWMLIALMGFSASRFQLRLIGEGNTLRFGIQMLYPILPLYYILLLIYGLFRNSFSICYVTLCANYLPPHNSLLDVYWFVSLYAQIILVLMIIAAMPFARDSLVRHPWRLPMAVTVFLLSIEAVFIWGIGDATLPKAWAAIHSRSLLPCLCIFLVGWMLHRSLGWKQKLASLTLGVAAWALLAVPHLATEKTILMLITFALLAGNPKIALPAKLTRFLQKLASATLFVYLLHEIVVFLITRMQLPHPITMLFSIVLSFWVAMMAKTAFNLLDRRILQLTDRG